MTLSREEIIALINREGIEGAAESLAKGEEWLKEQGYLKDEELP